MSILSPEKLNATAHAASTDDDFDMTFHDPPSSPFVSHLEYDNQENIAPNGMPTPVKPLLDWEDDVPQSAFKVLPDNSFGFKARASPLKMSPAKDLMDDFEDAALNPDTGMRTSPKKSSPLLSPAGERPESAMSSSSCNDHTPSTALSAIPAAVAHQVPALKQDASQSAPTPSHLRSLPHEEYALRDNEGLTVAMKYMEENNVEPNETLRRQSSEDKVYDLDVGIEDTDFNPDGPELTSADIDDTCFSTFSEMPGLDMTKFAFLKQTPSKAGTPRARAQMTPSTVRRTERTPSPTPRRAYKDNDTTNLLLDFTAQIESFASSRRNSPARGHASPSKSVTEPNLRSYYQNQRSPAKAQVPATPSHGRQVFNLLDFELPPPPTPRSQPTVTIRELESLKSQFQYQISSFTASLSGKEAEVDSLSRAVADAERRVGEALETVRDERSAREHAEAQMIDWKKKGEEVEKLLQDVQSELARNDAEREDLLARLADAEKRAEDAENRSSELETKVIEAESKNVDMTTFVNNEDGNENGRIYSEMECQAAIAEKVNEVARDLHTAYKAKHEKKIKALKDNYQRKADERCKELRVQIIRLERQVEEAEKKRDNTFSKIDPGKLDSQADRTLVASQGLVSSEEDVQRLEVQRTEIESLKAKLAGLQSELLSLRASQESLLEELETERIEKGELVAAAEQMLAMCGEKMGELQQEDLRRSQMGTAPTPVPKQRAAPEQAMRNTGFLAGGPSTNSRPGSALGSARPGSAVGDRPGAIGERGGSSIARPNGLRAPGGFGFQGAPGLSRSTSGGKSRLLSNIERMGGGKE